MKNKQLPWKWSNEAHTADAFGFKYSMIYRSDRESLLVSIRWKVGDDWYITTQLLSTITLAINHCESHHTAIWDAIWGAEAEDA